MSDIGDMSCIYQVLSVNFVHLFFVISDSQTNPCTSPSLSSPEPVLRRPSFTRSGSVRYQENEASPECNDKPSGKRKFKSKHLCDSDDQKVKYFLAVFQFNSDGEGLTVARYNVPRIDYLTVPPCGCKEKCYLCHYIIAATVPPSQYRLLMSCTT